jgi:Na+-transporting methylmalonyl-CoA/oxaloacetate decarboxylase gamma subunit
MSIINEVILIVLIAPFLFLFLWMSLALIIKMLISIENFFAGEPTPHPEEDNSEKIKIPSKKEEDLGEITITIYEEGNSKKQNVKQKIKY